MNFALLCPSSPLSIAEQWHACVHAAEVYANANGHGRSTADHLRGVAAELHRAMLLGAPEVQVLRAVATDTVEPWMVETVRNDLHPKGLVRPCDDEWRLTDAGIEFVARLGVT